MSRPNRRRAVRAVAPVAGLLAAGLLVWQGSYAAFSATTDNTGGRLDHRHPRPDQQRRRRRLLRHHHRHLRPGAASPTPTSKPGATGIKCITVQSTGTLARQPQALPRRHHAAPGACPGRRSSASRSTAAGVAAADERRRRLRRLPGRRARHDSTGRRCRPCRRRTACQTGMAVAPARQRVAYRITWTFTPPAQPPTTRCRARPRPADLTWEIQ